MKSDLLDRLEQEKVKEVRYSVRTDKLMEWLGKLEWAARIAEIENIYAKEYTGAF